ncbi:MAG: HAD hydrolase-like protein [Chloroflexi bacterium]|jgi:phosphoglycolate phosphatase-like HAD superfamily hydrolase|nr:MAG: hydrolase [Chloroflexi bacterium OLB13]MBC6956984.1 HAD family hydrolase [Chloroflexota bacterium]MBV6437310.1 Pyrophosphatase PpaX [Anaerolineae bacterium]MDL1915333.1 HAD family hydrolase [Anaerolineae bacterium CFX4]OQY86548.1 MAG: hypothetical protein B6D42_00980 [Anaerolineae bacterium UTCFX5]
MLILFDIDGTLIRSKGLGSRATHHTIYETFGLDIDLNGHRFGGKTDWFSLIELLTPVGITEEMIASKLPEYMQVKRRWMADLLREFPPWALPGALETVAALRDHGAHTLGILTGNVQTTALLKLEAVGLDPAWFPVGAYGHEAISRNDLPPLALDRAQRLTGRRFAPHDVVIVGDTAADIECARAHQLRVAAVTTGFEPRADLEAARPDYLIDSLVELLAIVNGV